MSTFTSRIISRLQRGWTLWQAVRLELVVWWRTRVVREHPTALEAMQWRAVPVACPCGERGAVVEPVDPAVRRVRWECPRCMRLTAEEVRDERPI